MFQKLGSFMNLIMREGDSRTFLLPLTNPWVPLYTFILYVIFVKSIGPKFMKNRKPFVLQNVLVIYNVFQVALSTYLFVLFSQHGWGKLSNWFKCKPIEESLNWEFQHLLAGHHLYYISKYTELLDTVFFVLRKKDKQISFLHVYHHGTMPFFTCLTLRFSPGSSVSFVGFLNCFVHIVMYGYYMLAGLGPKIQKYLWWKRYITSLQLVQFVILFFHFSIVSCSNCNVPKGLALFMTGNIAFNFALFYLFYRREYKQKMKVKIEKKTADLEFDRAKNDQNGFSYSNGISYSAKIPHQNGISLLNVTPLSIKVPHSNEATNCNGDLHREELNDNAAKLIVNSTIVSENLRHRTHS